MEGTLTQTCLSVADLNPQGDGKWVAHREGIGDPDPRIQKVDPLRGSYKVPLVV